MHKHRLKYMGLNSVSSIQQIGNGNFLDAFPQLIKLIILHAVVVLHSTHHIQMTCSIEGGEVYETFTGKSKILWTLLLKTMTCC